MTASEITALVSVAVTVITALLGGLLWVVKSQVSSMQKDLKPNGGSSIKDQLNRIEVDVRDVRGKVDDHISWHLGE